MEIDRLIDVYDDPRFKALVAGKTRLSWTLTAIMLALYFGFIGFAAFSPAMLGRPITNGPLSIGLVIGVGIIVAAIAMTGFYVTTVNARFEPMSEGIAQEFRK